MGLFDLFKKKEVVSINIPIEGNKVQANDKKDITEIVKPIEKAKDIIVSNEIVSDSIYQFNGINYAFIDKLHFVSAEQKNKLIKFIEKTIVKFKFNEITSQSKYFKFEDNLSKYYDFADNYEDKYSGDAHFPYFDIRLLVSWTITDIIEIKNNGIVIETRKNVQINEEQEIGTDICVFNIKNKSIKESSNIELEEKIIIDCFNDDRCFKYYIISSPLGCLMDYYFKSKDFKKVDDLLGLLINKTVQEDLHNIERDFEHLTHLSNIEQNSQQAIDYTNKGIEFIKTNFPIPKTKTMGSIYKTLVHLLFEQKEYQKALLTINPNSALENI